MARRDRRGYQEYRGRSRGGGSIALKVIIALLVILLIAGVVLVVLMDRYVEYTDDGVRVNWPWQQAQPSEAPAVSDPVVILTAQPTPEPTPTPRPLSAVRAVEVTAGQLTAGTAAQAAADAGGNALVVTMKEPTGRLLWQSGTQLAQDSGVNAADRTVQWAIRDLAEEGEVYLVARIDCFRDVALARSDTLGATLHTKGGNIWYDSNGRCWVSPASQAVTDYLAALCVELADMGFDEIVLDSAGYPYFGEVEVLATDENRPEDRAAPVTAFYEKLSAALEGRGVTLSVTVPELPAEGAQLYSGVTLEAVSGYADRAWLAQGLDAQACAAALDGWAGEMDERLVVIGGQGEGSWALLR